MCPLPKTGLKSSIRDSQEVIADFFVKRVDSLKFADGRNGLNSKEKKVNIDRRLESHRHGAV